MSYPATSGMSGEGANHGIRRGGVHHPYLQAHAATHHDASLAAGHHYTAAQHHDGMSAVVNQFGNLALPATGVPQVAAPMAMAGNAPPGFMAPPDGPVVFAPYAGPVQPVFGMGQVPDNVYNTAVNAGPYVQGNIPAGYAPCVVPFTPARPAYGDRMDHGLRDVPGLDNRRGSYSTTATESTPGTPFFGSLSDRHGGARIISGDRSSYTTPSPSQIVATGLIGPVATKENLILDAELETVIKQDPAIPTAVPAVFTTPDQRKALDQCLENRIASNKNVYIRGLHPTTDDDLLLKYAARFGEVEQSKAIIDTATGACKGFGFAKFKDVNDSEKCIRGFYMLGYEVGFARESFNARLKAEGDKSSTNLYISNLPKIITETQLASIFAPYHILSSKILRDSMGNSRGVGFARFESRAICEEVIRKFHGQCIGENPMFTVQVRYADTPAQKELKRVTAKRRQYRTNEYNIGAYGTMAVGLSPYPTGPFRLQSCQYIQPPAAPYDYSYTRAPGRSRIAAATTGASAPPATECIGVANAPSGGATVRRDSVDDSGANDDTPIKVKTQSSPAKASA